MRHVKKFGLNYKKGMNSLLIYQIIRRKISIFCCFFKCVYILNRVIMSGYFLVPFNTWFLTGLTMAQPHDSVHCIYATRIQSEKAEEWGRGWFWLCRLTTRQEVMTGLDFLSWRGLGRTFLGWLLATVTFQSFRNQKYQRVVSWIQMEVRNWCFLKSPCVKQEQK